MIWTGPVCFLKVYVYSWHFIKSIKCVSLFFFPRLIFLEATPFIYNFMFILLLLEIIIFLIISSLEIFEGEPLWIEQGCRNREGMGVYIPPILKNFANFTSKNTLSSLKPPKINENYELYPPMLNTVRQRWTWVIYLIGRDFIWTNISEVHESSVSLINPQYPLLSPTELFGRTVNEQPLFEWKLAWTQMPSASK